MHFLPRDPVAGSGRTCPSLFARCAPTLLEHALPAFTDHPGVRDARRRGPSGVREAAASLAGGAAVIAGGASRQASVSCGLALADDIDAVLVHDVARPFVPGPVIDRVLGPLPRVLTR